jgi:hypothetical protein
MDTSPEAATAETRRMLERWGTLHAGRSALGLTATLIFRPTGKVLFSAPSQHKATDAHSEDRCLCHRTTGVEWPVELDTS